MFAMQYGFDFPANFDMGAILARAADIGPRFDELPGLYHKAFLVGRNSPGTANRYTPFYLWREVDGLMTFLQSESFRAMSAHYGRLAVQRWNEVAFIEGPAVEGNPGIAVQEVVSLAPDVDLQRLRDDELAALDGLSGEPGLQTAYVGLDPGTWQLMRVSLWTDRPVRTTGRVLDVAYLSRTRRARTGLSAGVGR